jgi:hypothetical protein
MAQPEHPEHPHEGGPPGRNPDFIPPGQRDKPDKPEKPDEETEPEVPPDPDAPHPDQTLPGDLPHIEHHEGDEPDKAPA